MDGGFQWPTDLVQEPPGEYVIKGTSWSNDTSPFVLRRIHPYEELLTRGMNLKMAFQIAAENETVVVPAGRFKC